MGRNKPRRWLVLTVILTLTLGPSSVLSWEEFTTHFAMSRYSAEGSKRLKNFLDDTNLDRYAMARTEQEFQTWAQQVEPSEDLEAAFREASIGRDLDPRDIIRFGTIHEDCRTPYWRSNSHFYFPHTDPSKAHGLDLRKQGGGFAPLVSEAAQAWANANGRIHPSPDWAEGTIGDPDNQKFDFHDFNDYTEKGWTERDAAVRRPNLFRAFFCAGHLLHLTEDLLQPGHSRNDAHVGRKHDDIQKAIVRGDVPILDFLSDLGPAVMEEYGERKLRPSLFDANLAARAATSRYSAPFKQHFIHAATLANRYYFSEDTVVFGGPPAPLQPPFTREEFQGPIRDQTNWFEHYNAWNSSDIGRRAGARELTRIGVTDARLGDTVDPLTPLAYLRMIAEATNGQEFARERSLRPLSLYYAFSLEAGDGRTEDRLELEYAKQVVKSAVSHDLGVLDFLYRGRLGMEFVGLRPKGGATIRVWNASVASPDGRPRPDSEDLTWVNGTIRVYWEFRPMTDPPQPATLQQAATVPAPITVVNWRPLTVDPQFPDRGKVVIDLDPPAPMPGLGVRGIRVWYEGDISTRVPEPGFAAACVPIQGLRDPGGAPLDPVCGGD